jgi:hypothetical protein
MRTDKWFSPTAGNALKARYCIAALLLSDREKAIDLAICSDNLTNSHQIIV